MEMSTCLNYAGCPIKKSSLFDLVVSKGSIFIFFFYYYKNNDFKMQENTIKHLVEFAI
jgi:hypothetical protein